MNQAKVILTMPNGKRECLGVIRAEDTKVFDRVAAILPNVELVTDDEPAAGIAVILEGGLVRGVYVNERYTEAEVFDFDTFDGGDRSECDDLVEKIRDAHGELYRDAASWVPGGLHHYKTLAQENAEAARQNVGVL